MSTAVVPRLPSLTSSLALNVKTIEKGVPLASFTAFAEQSGLPLRELHEVVIPARTLKHRRARKEALSRDESDKLARVARVFDHAVQVFTDDLRARRWLEKPNGVFEGRTPLVMLRTETGARMVDDLLGQIDHGYFA